MISLRDGKLTDIMPDSLILEPEVKALSAAFSSQVARLIDYCAVARTYSAIASLPDTILDVLAVELRTPAYSENYSLAMKRRLIQNTLLFYMKMGTPEAVNSIILMIFEDGYISEWPEYGGEPWHFKAYTRNPAVTAENVQEFIRVLASVKRASAWLDEVVLAITTPTLTQYIGHCLHTGDVERLKLATL